MEKVSVEEIFDEAELDMLDEEQIEYWAKYVASLCKDCGSEPGEPHLCENNKG